MSANGEAKPVAGARPGEGGEQGSGAAPVMPYSSVVGQEELKLALELCYVEPRIGGVLLSGERGTAKSTTVRAFSWMTTGELPVTLPINATEDRVVGGWAIQELVQGQTKFQPGLLEEAHNKLLYIDEVNLLDDHIVNILLDVTSTGVLAVEHNGIRERKNVRVTLVGTMNPEEGLLRPQLLDRFGLMVGVAAEAVPEKRRKVLESVLGLADPAKHQTAQARDAEHRQRLQATRERLVKAQALPGPVLDACVKLAQEFKVEGHRGDVVLAFAARAHAALQGRVDVELKDVAAVAAFALQHRRKDAVARMAPWGDEERQRMARLLA